jgi:hypothetical protein
MLSRFTKKGGSSEDSADASESSALSAASLKLETLRNSLPSVSTTSAAAQLQAVKEKHAAKYSETKTQLFSVLEPTPELEAAFPDSLNCKKDDSDKALRWRYVNYAPPEAGAEVGLVSAAELVSGSNVGDSKYGAKLDSASASLSKAAGVDVKALTVQGVQEAEDSLKLRTNGVGYACGMCVSGSLVRANVICTLDDFNVPIVQIQLNHPKIPKLASIIDVPVGTQEIPVPFLAVPCTALGLFGLVMTVTVQLIYEGEDVMKNEGQTIGDVKASASEGVGKAVSGVKSGMQRIFGAKKSMFGGKKAEEEKEEAPALAETPAAETSAAPAEVAVPAADKKDIKDFKQVRVHLGLSFCIQDAMGILAFAVPETPVWMFDTTIDADKLKEARKVAKEKTKAALGK